MAGDVELNPGPGSPRSSSDFSAFDIDEVPAEKCSLILTTYEKPDVTREYQQNHDVEILSRALDGAHLQPVTGDYVAKFTNPPNRGFLTYVKSLLDTDCLQIRTVVSGVSGSDEDTARLILPYCINKTKNKT